MNGIRDIDKFKSFTLKQLAPGDVLYRQGDAEGHVFVIASGHLKLEHLDTSGKACITAVLGAGEILGPGLTGDTFAGQTAIAKRPTDIHCFTSDTLRSLALSEGSLLADIISTLARRQAITERRLHAVLTLPVRGRIAVTLKDLVSVAGGQCVHGHEVDVPLTQQELADMVGASRPVVSAELNELRREGLLDYTRGHICINRLDTWNQLF
ncbi:MAG: Crp/Fnr family transcriptional regulator [Alteromonadaceae bacterium]|nr:Crp/Fnr family transcriptional regulator [Alteromonadaceae bacterium]MBH86225.1 Crp/Fnr family transcriptional regulator [Alteromonadaceae bacterium]|tara:strand:- start:6987 stop:7616 length:630 start_codon:yes stop_codon:yes gene_type:complete